MSDFKQIPNGKSCMCSFDNCQKGGKIYTEGVFNRSTMKVNTAHCTHISNSLAQFTGHNIWESGDSDLTHLDKESFE